ncbi:MAG: hypothetical protein MUE44_15765 [Oscillatoriaceae cyanobacterium Prado104]|jgi:hypothetical protein|nr:hypothetical protein [Oscillatoriaceae cyanobacterium Prado104]
MNTPISVKPISALKRPGTDSPASLLAASGAAVILGGSSDLLQVAVPVAPTASTMFGPRGVCLTPNGSLWVADTGHHRLLGWRQCPTADGQPADWVIGQPDFDREGQNAKGAIGPATLSVPTGICACGDGLAVADAWNHRVLIWQQIPQDSNVPADLVLGQADFSQGEPNRGTMDAGADRLHWPYGVFYHEGKLFVADTGNRRVLIWNELPVANGQPADLVLGQADMNSRHENGGGTPTASSMRWGHALAVWRGNLALVDAGNNRVMLWEGIPAENNAPCAVVLGQTTFDRADINQGNYYPSAGTLNLPYGIAAADDWLLVSDTANSRLLGWHYRSDLTSLQGVEADALAGQVDFQSKGENRSYGLPARDSFCWAYGLQVQGEIVAIADSGNNRVLLSAINRIN